MKTSRMHLPLAALLAASMATACATSPETKAERAQAEAYQKAVDEAMKPASAEERAAADRADPITRANFWAKEHTKDQEDLPTALAFADALSNLGSNERVVEVMSRVMVVHPDSFDVFMVLGRALARDGQLDQAAQAYLKAADIDPQRAESWSALGTVLAKTDRHLDAQTAYLRALEIEPLRATTLTNYGLSLALTGDLEEAEAKLRLANEQPGANAQTRENLALILGLQGRYDEMKLISGTNAPSKVIEDNVAMLREMIQPARSWEALAENAVSGEIPQTPEQAETAATGPVPEAAPVTAVEDAPLELAGMAEATQPEGAGLRLRRTTN